MINLSAFDCLTSSEFLFPFWPLALLLSCLRSEHFGVSCCLSEGKKSSWTTGTLLLKSLLGAVWEAAVVAIPSPAFLPGDEATNIAQSMRQIEIDDPLILDVLDISNF